jgi:hypothetical protein
MKRRLPLVAFLIHAGGRAACLLMGEDRKRAAVGQNDANDPERDIPPGRHCRPILTRRSGKRAAPDQWLSHVGTDDTLFNTTALRITRPRRLFRFATPRAIQGSAPRLGF